MLSPCKYFTEPHFDYFNDQTNQQHGGHRVARVLMYLSNVQKDGETILPNWGKNATNGHSAEVVLYPHSAICVICRGNYHSQRMTADQTLQKMAIQAGITGSTHLRASRRIHIFHDHLR